MNEYFDFMRDAQKFFKDKIHALNNAIAHEDNPANISKLKFQLSHAELDWKKYSELRQKLFQTNQENPESCLQIICMALSKYETSNNFKKRKGGAEQS